jgi:hypothetical protein
VNAHFQNGIAKKMIRDLQESTRKQLLHAKSRWPKAIELNLWPYALRLANHLRNLLPDKDDATSPIERFSRVQVAPHLKENHPFGCPVYALNNRLQSGNRIPKWDLRARLGVYLGQSPRHASSVSLVLSLETGLVSPQYHVRHDDFFETVRPTAQNPSTLSHCQALAGFKEMKAIRASEGEKITDGNFDPFIPSSEMITERVPMESFPLADTNPQPAETDIEIPEEINQNVTTTHEFFAEQPTEIRRTRTRIIKKPERLIEVAFSSYYKVLHEDDYKLQDDMSDPIAFLSHHSDPDTMYFHEAVVIELLDDGLDPTDSQQWVTNNPRRKETGCSHRQDHWKTNKITRSGLHTIHVQIQSHAMR